MQKLFIGMYKAKRNLLFNAFKIVIIAEKLETLVYYICIYFYLLCLQNTLSKGTFRIHPTQLDD